MKLTQLLYNIFLIFTIIKLTYHSQFDKILHRMGDYMNFKAKSIIFLRILLSALTLLLIVFIFSNSVKNAEASSESSGRIVAFLNRICTLLGLKFTFTQPVVRTLAHFCEFGLLGVLSQLTFLSCFGVKAKAILSSVFLVILTALTDEVIQLFSEGRAFQISDLIIDFSGSLLGLVAIFLIAVLINNHRLRKSEKE